MRLALEAAGYNGQGSGRVREIPDQRTIRYYTTLGILDRPVEFRGRTAYYGRKHLLQLVAIKRLQARGLSLVQVQGSIAGADESTLAAFAELPADFWERQSKIASAAQGRTPLRSASGAAALAGRSRFWACRPVATTAAEEATAGTEIAARPAVALSLGPGVRLVIEGLDPRQVTPEKLESLKPALADLAAAIRRLGWAPGPTTQPRDTCERQP
ncbi:MAG: helix-turn-helix domain-containing protein [Thermoguttaceae bacterium]|nr:helix-turn-helix domain-containing protein [Thermoguttaceae bacterium]